MSNTTPQALVPRFPAASAPASIQDVLNLINSKVNNYIPQNGPNYRYNVTTGEFQLHNVTTNKFQTIDTVGNAGAESIELGAQTA